MTLPSRWSADGYGTIWHRNVSENFNWLNSKNLLSRSLLPLKLDDVFRFLRTVCTPSGRSNRIRDEEASVACWHCPTGNWTSTATSPADSRNETNNETQRGSAAAAATALGSLSKN